MSLIRNPVQIFIRNAVRLVLVTPFWLWLALPDFQDCNRMSQIISGVIKQAVTQSGADQAADDHILEKPVNIVAGATLHPENPLHDQQAQKKAQREKKPVPAKGNRADRDYLRADIPDNIAACIHFG